MSVLVEALSVVVRRETLEARYPGGVAAYQADCPNGTFCADAHLTRVGFMSPVDVGAFDRALQSHFGLLLVNAEGAFADIAIVDQETGPTTQCLWIRFERGEVGPARCWLSETEPGDLAVPAGWAPKTLHFVPNEEMPNLYVEKSGNLDQFIDPDSGELLYSGRPFSDLHEVEDLYRRAKQHEELCELVEASHLYEQAVRINPDNANLWYAAGVVRVKVDSAAVAIPFFEKALELAPTFQMAAANLGAALSSSDRSDEALAWLRRAVELGPSDPLARWNLATELEKTRSPASGEAFREFIRTAMSTTSSELDLASAIQYATPRASAIAEDRDEAPSRPDGAIDAKVVTEDGVTESPAPPWADDPAFEDALVEASLSDGDDGFVIFGPDGSFAVDLGVQTLTQFAGVLPREWKGLDVRVSRKGLRRFAAASILDRDGQYHHVQYARWQIAETLMPSKRWLRQHGFRIEERSAVALRAVRSGS